MPGTTTAAELAALMKKENTAFLLDVREPFELAAFGAIPGVWNIPIREIGQRLNELPRDTWSLIIVVCQSGNRSCEVAHYLTKLGYSNVYNLSGGTSAWLQSGNPVVRAGQPVGG